MCIDVCKKDTQKAADLSKVVQYATNIACLQTPLPTGIFSDSVVEGGGNTAPPNCDPRQCGWMVTGNVWKNVILFI